MVFGAGVDRAVAVDGAATGRGPRVIALLLAALLALLLAPPASARAAATGSPATATPTAGAVGAEAAAPPVGTTIDLDVEVRDVGPVARGGDGRMWFGSPGWIGAATVDGRVELYPTGSRALPRNLVLGSDGNVWYSIDKTLGRVTPAGTITTFTAPVSIDRLAADPTGDLWFTGASDSIGRATTSGVITIVAGAAQGVDEPGAIAPGPGGLWFANVGDGSLMRITTSGAVARIGAAGTGAIAGLVAGPDGAMWFITNQGVLGRSTTAGVRSTFAAAKPSGAGILTVGANGSVWFVQGTSEKALGEVTMAGEVLDHHYQQYSTTYLALAAGPDGRLWVSATGSRLLRDHAVYPGLPEVSVAALGEVGADVLVPVADDDLWFLGGGAYDGWLGHLDPSGVLRLQRGYTGLARGADGNLWFAHRVDDEYRVDRVSPSGVTASATIPYAVVGGFLVASDALYLGLFNATGSVRIGWDLTITKLAKPAFSQYGSVPVPGPGGSLWWTEGSYPWTLVRLDPDGTRTELHSDLLVSSPWLWFGPDGTMWVLRSGLPTLHVTAAGQLEVVDPANQDATRPQRLVSGPDGGVWYHDSSSGLHQFGRASAGMPAVGPNCKGTRLVASPTSVWQVCDDGRLLGIRVTGAPGAPRLPVSQVGDRGLGVAWSEPQLLGTAPTPSYVATLQPGDRTCTVERRADHPVSSCWFGGLTNGVAYTVSIAAVNAVGPGAPLVVGPLVPRSHPAPPTQVVATPGDGRATVAFVPGSAEGAPITSFRVTASPGGATCGATPSAASCVVEDLTNGTPYTFVVVATNAEGPSAPSLPSAAVAPRRFADVPAGAPFFADVEWLAASGIAAGFADGSFHPGAPVSRGAMAAFLHRFLEPGAAAPPCAGDVFTDVPSGSAFCGEVEWLAARGIVTGDAGGTYRPAASVSRQAMVAFLHRTWTLAATSSVSTAASGASDASAASAGLSAAVDSCPPRPFSDVPVASVFCGDIAWAKATGIVTGDASGTFRPADAVSRQAMAAFLHRLDGEVDR